MLIFNKRLMNLKLVIDMINRKNILLLWLAFVLIIFSIYISTETIVPKEFSYLNISIEDDHHTIKFDFRKVPEI